MTIQQAKVELRGKIDRDVVDLIDALAIARRCDRIEILSEVLAEWKEKVTHEANVIHRVMTRNGS